MQQPGRTFGALLRQFRTERGLTQKELATRAQMSVRALSDLERGVRYEPYAATFKRLADAIDLSSSARVALRAALPETPNTLAGRSSVRVERSHNLPAELSTFVGRRRELDELGHVLWQTRLLSITGPPGVGKSRLAVRLASRYVERFADGVCYVDLALVAENVPAVAQAIAAALQVPGQPGAALVDVLAAAARARDQLLVLDNCTRLTDACAELITTLLATCPDLRVVVTSREALRISGEVVLPLAPLECMPAGPDGAELSDGVRLFIDRARAVQPDLNVDDQHLDVVAELCARLDGLPLAIELAAAWVRVLELPELAKRIYGGITPLLGTRDAPSHQQTLAVALDWSVRLLSPDNRRLLERLGVFAGGATLEAIECVCTDESLATERILPCLVQLVQASLVQRRSRPEAEPRFELLHVIRDYARAQLRDRGELAALQRAHASYFAALLELPAYDLHALNPGAALAHVEADLDNVRTAISSTIEHREIAPGFRLLWALGPWIERRGHPAELLDRGEALLVLDAHSHSSRSGERARAQCTISFAALMSGRIDRADQLAAAAVEEFKALPDAEGVLLAEYLRGLGAALAGRPDAAETLHRSVISPGRRIGATRIVSWALALNGMVLLARGQIEGARQSVDESLALALANDDRRVLQRAYLLLAAILCRQADVKGAHAAVREGLRRAHEEGDAVGVAYALETLAWVAELANDHERAARLIGAAQRQHERLGVGLSPNPYDPPSHDEVMRSLASALGDAELAELIDEGGYWDVDEAVAYASLVPAHSRE